MKKYSLYILSAFICLITFSSCEDYFGDINVDPDSPTVVTPNVILPLVEGRLAIVMGGDASRHASLFTQHINGIGRQFVVFNDYGIQGGDTDALWSNMYSGVLMDSRQIQRVATEGGFNHYNGVAKALEAYSWMVMTDLFGDIPYSEALKGTAAENLQPAFDSQESIYNGIFATLDEARADLAADANGNAPGGDDFIYNGDVAKWTNFCNVLEARGRLHLAKDDAANYQRALDALAKGGFASSEDDARFPFGSSASEAAPWFQYLEQRTDTDVGGSYRALMEGLGDPRLDILGAPHTVPDGSETDHPIFVQNRAFPILTYMEQEFIRAECLAETGGDPSDALSAAVGASFAEAGLTSDDAAAYTSGLGASVEDIMTQKYIAMLADMEVFNDWRRTGVPSLTPNIGDQVPRKFPLAQTEVLSNTNAPTVDITEIYNRVWWDQ